MANAVARQDAINVHQSFYAIFTRRSPMLTKDEIRAVRQLGELYTFIVQNIIDHEPPSDAVAVEDSRELTYHVHSIQHMIMAQSAAREHPEHFRLLGKSL